MGRDSWQLERRPRWGPCGTAGKAREAECTSFVGKWAADNGVWENLILGKLGKTVMGNNPASEERDAGILPAFPCPGSMPSPFNINVCFLWGVSWSMWLRCCSGQLLTGEHGGTNGPGPERGSFQSFCLNLWKITSSLYGCQAGRRWAQDIRIKPTQRNESEEVKRDGCSGSLTETLHPSSHDSSELSVMRAREFPLCPTQFEFASVTATESLTHSWGKGEVTPHNIKYVFLNYYISLMGSLHEPMVAIFSQVLLPPHNQHFCSDK